jgi:uncharacterized protein DUF1444
MAFMPQEPEAFAEQVAILLKRLQPEYDIDLVGPRELLVNGRRLDLENLLRMVAHEPNRGTDIVEHFLDQLFTSDAVAMTDLSIDLARMRIMPRIQPVSIFEHLSEELVAHVPYVNGTVIVFVIDMPQMTVSITTEQAVKWQLSMDELDDLARENLAAYTPDFDLQIVESREGGKAVIIAEQDGYDAARLLYGSLHEKIAPHLGGDFYVATPSRDMFLALSLDPAEFRERLCERVKEDYQRLPYPICPDLFYVTMDGVAGTRGKLAA